MSSARLEQGLRALTDRLETGARIAVITFHSLEDRIVKNFFRDRSREWLDRPEWPEPRPNPDYDLQLVTAKPVEPGRNRTARQSTFAQRETARGGKNQMNRIAPKNIEHDRRASLARWIVLTAFFALTGLIYVYLDYSAASSGRSARRRSRTSWPVCAAQNDVASGQIAALTSRVGAAAATEGRLSEDDPDRGAKHCSA